MQEQAQVTAKAPWHLWAVGLAGLIWNGFGGYDYIMTRMRDMAYLDGMTGGHGHDIVEWVDKMPAYAHFFWPIGVWASVLGSVLLMMRSRHAVPAFLVSLVGAAISFVGQLTSQIPAHLDNTGNKVMPLVIVAVIALQWWYARRQRAAGWLR